MASESKDITHRSESLKHMHVTHTHTRAMGDTSRVQTTHRPGLGGFFAGDLDAVTGPRVISDPLHHVEEIAVFLRNDHAAGSHGDKEKKKLHNAQRQTKMVGQNESGKQLRHISQSTRRRSIVGDTQQRGNDATPQHEWCM